MSKHTIMIERWVDWAFAHERPYWNPVLRSIRDEGGLTFYPNRVDFTRGEGVAVQVLCARDARPVPLARMALPNQSTHFKWGEIWRALQRAEIPVVVIPRAVLENSDIVRSSIEVLDTERKRRFARPPHQLIRATVRPWMGTKHRVALFLSGYDLRERGLSYFFCELPPSATPTTIEEAYQALKPESVKRGEAQGRRIVRQGDLFFIETRAEEGPPYDENADGQNGFLFGTNHFAERRVRHGGVTYARGKITHRPLGRNADHRPLKLPGKNWWIAVRNTVPVVDK